MGGSALLIYGRVSDALLEPQPAPRSVLDRLLGRAPTQAPSWSDVGRDRRMIDLPTDGLNGLGATFIDYVAERLQPPWKATTSVLDYLRLGVTTVYVRGERAAANPPEWYVQIAFSGCAGMAEVSSELTAHWAERWYSAEHDGIIAKYFRPYGFEPDGRIEGVPPAGVFVPIGIAGYALYNGEKASDEDLEGESRYFDIDASALETLDDSADELAKLDAEGPRLIPGKSCCCQFCAPRFDAEAIDRLTPFQ